MPSRLRITLLVLVAVVSAACGSTTVEADATTTTLAPPSAALGADLGAVLSEMVSLATGLGDQIVEGGAADDADLLRIRDLWAATGGAMNDIDPPLFREIEHQLELLDTAVGRRRPADADKASRNLSIVVTTFLDRYPT
jgi:hypothetical protein